MKTTMKSRSRTDVWLLENPDIAKKIPKNDPFIGSVVGLPGRVCYMMRLEGFLKKVGTARLNRSQCGIWQATDTLRAIL